jgi:hypothetical protein
VFDLWTAKAGILLGVWMDAGLAMYRVVLGMIVLTAYTSGSQPLSNRGQVNYFSTRRGLDIIDTRPR